MSTTPLAGLRQAVGFLTVVGGAGAPTPAAMRWFPVVGAGIGGVVGLAWWGANEIWPPLLAAVVAVLVDLALTGALHHDGLADAADGLLPHMERERRLVVMRQPDVGTFGVMALVAATLVRTGALATTAPRPLAVAGLWAASRAAMAVIAHRLPYARQHGLASDLLGSPWGLLAVTGLVVSLPLVAIGAGVAGLVALAVLVIVAGAVAALAARRIGGFTGDVLGAAGLLGETAGLLALAARW